ncbi:MAG TPA: hypothetical protein VFI34_06330 [Candidatus Limnocylindrales bacterium]|nr:hypothetical protein [Candidatus Limnocylindrales bacterium]
MSDERDGRSERLSDRRRPRAGDGPADGVADADDTSADGEDLTSADYSVAFSPRNVAVGLAIVAGLVAFAASRRRRRRDEDA